MFCRNGIDLSGGSQTVYAMGSAARVYVQNACAYLTISIIFIYLRRGNLRFPFGIVQFASTSNASRPSVCFTFNTYIFFFIPIFFLLSCKLELRGMLSVEAPGGSHALYLQCHRKKKCSQRDDTSKKYRNKNNNNRSQTSCSDVSTPLLIKRAKLKWPDKNN